MRRVAITGMGVICCLGHDLDVVAAALNDGKSGIEVVPERKKLGFRSALAGMIHDFPMPNLPRGFERQLGLNGRMAVAASYRAVEDAGLLAKDLASERCGVIVGNDGNLGEVFQLVDKKFNKKRSLPALALARAMTSTASANLSVLFNIRGHCYSIGAACASGAVAIGDAYRVIVDGRQDILLCGGVHEGSPEVDILFEALRVLSSREGHPKEASRPFDESRDGLVPSGGCGMVILEEYERALRRGARIYAELIGYGISSDGCSITTPSSEGTARAMRLALADAGILPAEVDYINAHATSTPIGDAAEAKAIYSVFSDRPYVSSTKSMTGHEVAAGGATEMIYTLLMMRQGFIAPSININAVSDDCSCIRIVANRAIDTDIRVALTNSSGFGGVNTSIILRNVS